MPYFFLSYAAENDDKRHLPRRFFDDLQSKVANLAGCTLEEAGFADWNQQRGTDYLGNISEQLRSSNVMVAIYSPHYFGKPFCGKEFGVFLERRQAYRDKNPASLPTNIIPVLWEPSPRHMPFTARKFLASRDRTCDYEKKGLEHILESGVAMEGPRRDWYVAFKRELAEQIVNAVWSFPLDPPPGNLTIETAENAFEARPPREVRQLSEMKIGPKSASFLFVGRPEWEWDLSVPPAPPRQSSAGFVSVSVAKSREVEPQAIPLDLNEPSSTFAALEELGNKNGPVVVLVERRALQDANYREWLRQYNQKEYRHCATIVIGPEKEPVDILSRYAAGPLFFSDIPDAERLGHVINSSLENLGIASTNRGTGKDVGATSSAEGNSPWL